MNYCGIDLGGMSSYALFVAATLAEFCMPEARANWLHLEQESRIREASKWNMNDINRLQYYRPPQRFP